MVGGYFAKVATIQYIQTALALNQYQGRQKLKKRLQKRLLNGVGLNSHSLLKERVLNDYSISHYFTPS